MNGGARWALIRQFVAGALSRREFIARAVALGLSPAAIGAAAALAAAREAFGAKKKKEKRNKGGANKNNRKKGDPGKRTKRKKRKRRDNVSKLPPAPPDPGFAAYYTRLDGVQDVPKDISGAYADIVVQIESQQGRLVFSRAFSYRPEWQTDNGHWLVDHLAQIKGDGPANGRFDQSNQYAYARIVELGPQQVKIEWRYFPNLDRLDPTAVVQELYVIGDDGRVVREHKPGTATIDAWNDPLNKTVQTFDLTPNAIANLQTTAPGTSPPPGPVAGNPLRGPVVAAPVAWWRFDDARGDTAEESQSGRQDRIDGHKSLWKRGVSGTALGFDGYASQISVPAAEAPSLGEAFTLEAWIALAAYPWNLAPIVHQSSDLGGRGYYLGVDAHGRVVFTVNDQKLTAKMPGLPLTTWACVAGVYDGETMTVYVNGKRQDSRRVSGAANPPSKPLLIGINDKPTLPTDAVRGGNPNKLNHFATLFGLEGLIDEVRVYDVALSAEDVAASFENFRPSANVMNQPDLQSRALPGNPGPAAKFGATHTHIRYHDLWDNMWRVTDAADVLVKFDALPTSLVYWRGTTHGVNLVTEKNFWMSDQSIELADEGVRARTRSLAEHMSDKEARRSYVRVIENTEARVVVHWRYAAVDVFHNLVNAKAFIDELHTTYPDGVLIRDVRYYDDRPGPKAEIEYHDFQLFLSPGERPEDMVGLRAVKLGNLKGRTKDLVWPLPDEYEVKLKGAQIALINLLSDWKVFGISQRGSFFPWGSFGEFSRHVEYDGGKFPFGGPWNHWPISRIPSDGRFVTAYDRVSHFALGNLSGGFGANALLYGFTEAASARDLLPLAKSWRTPPPTSSVTGLTSRGYNKDGRAYEFMATADEMAFTLRGSGKQPIVNPCFVVRRWGGDQAATVQIDGNPTAGVRQGIVRDGDGTRSLILWVPFSATSARRFTIARSG